jgi:hypothetical protein
MSQEREDYRELDRPPKRRIFSPVQIVVITIGIALGLAPLVVEFAMWAWGRWGP